MIIISILIVTVSLIIWRGGFFFDLVLEDKSQQWSFLNKWPV